MREGTLASVHPWKASQSPQQPLWTKFLDHTGPISPDLMCKSFFVFCFLIWNLLITLLMGGDIMRMESWG
ncbi:hypothetical protein KGF37_19115, partial [Clostridioides sp. ZZV14-6105]|nr:hypothetical protein [Clostridioides sp. ZZV14-6105]